MSTIHWENRLFAHRLTVFRDAAANSPTVIAPKVPAVPIQPSIMEYQVIVIKVAIPADARAQDVADPITTRSAAIDPTFAGIVAVYKLATLVIWVAENSTTTMASSVALT